MKRFCFVLVATFVLAACPDDSSSGYPASGPVETCTKAGVQCKMSGGKLGVCSTRPDGEFFCMSQH